MFDKTYQNFFLFSYNNYTIIIKLSQYFCYYFRTLKLQFCGCITKEWELKLNSHFYMITGFPLNADKIASITLIPCFL